jgi:myo-inositol-1(or 4)-monophosphatase
VGGPPPAGQLSSEPEPRQPEAAIAEEAARAAGTLLLERFGTERALERTKSSPTDLVSEADLLAEKAIRDVLAARAPDDAIMGEEGADTPGTSGRRWIVDPLDGTINFLYGNPQWAVSVACEGIAGVVFDPSRDELFMAADGAATVNGEPLHASQRDELSHALVGTGFGYESEVRAGQAEIVARLLPQVRDIRRAGSAALDLAWAAAGRLDAFYERGVKPWDIAAGTLLCEAVGLEVRELQARDRLPAGIVAAPAALLEPLLELVS